MTEAISITESKKLVALEKVIETGRKTFIEVGIALAEIRESKLYRADYNTFEEYCREKWDWDKSYCTRLIGAAEVAKTVPMVTISNERQARALAKVEPSKRVEVLEKAAAAGPVTARAIKEAAEPEIVLPDLGPAFEGWRVDGGNGRSIPPVRNEPEATPVEIPRSPINPIPMEQEPSPVERFDAILKDTEHLILYLCTVGKTKDVVKAFKFLEPLVKRLGEAR